MKLCSVTSLMKFYPLPAPLGLLRWALLHTEACWRD
jgi:hypothetical protein